MGTTFRFLATVEEGRQVVDWFRALPEEPVESMRLTGSLFYFREFGPLLEPSSRSPLVNVFLPVERRGVLTTIGEVHFLATSVSAFPGLRRVSQRFRNWLKQHPCVFSQRSGFVGEYNYFLEGSVLSVDLDIYALPGGLAALQRGEYFVSEDDNDHLLDLVCRKLQLRGVPGASRG